MREGRGVRTSARVRVALRLSATATVAVLAGQFATAGTLLSGDGGLGVHAIGAVVLHVVSGLTLVVAATGWWWGLIPSWAVVLTSVVFGLGFVQAYYGASSTLWVHVPGAMVLTVGAVWVMAFSFGLGGSSRYRAEVHAG